MRSRGAVRRRRARGGPHLPGRRPPLRAGPGDGPRTGHGLGVRGPARRHAGVAPARLLPPALRDPHPRRGRHRPGRVRLLPLGRAARRRAGSGGPRRPGHPGGPAGRRAGGRAPRRTPPPGRPGVRGRDLQGHPPLARRPPGPGGPAGGAGGGLRGVHPPLLRVLARPRDPLAALHGPQLHDLRRPRRHRRLEHQRGLAHRHAGHPLVARAHPERPDVLLGVPAPRQPLPAELAADPVHAAVRAVPDPVRTRCAPTPPRPTRTRRRSAGATAGTSGAYAC